MADDDYGSLASIRIAVEPSTVLIEASRLDTPVVQSFRLDPPMAEDLALRMLDAAARAREAAS